MSASSQISTISVEDALDFACNLLSSALAAAGEAGSLEAQQLLRALAQYIELRYVGELRLALEYLVDLGHACETAPFQREQFWAQLEWVANQLGMAPGWQHPSTPARA